MFLSVDDVRRALATRPDAEPVARADADAGELRHAAVAAVLREGGEGAEVLLIRRVEREGDPWSGHMALPGGRHDPGDATLLETAKRETLEEVGVDLSAAELLGRLEELVTPAPPRMPRMRVSPFVFLAPHPVAPRLQASEVAEALWAPLGPLYRGELDTTFPWSLRAPDGTKLDLKLPAWDVRGRIVWGLTHRMISSLFERVRG